MAEECFLPFLLLEGGKAFYNCAAQEFKLPPHFEGDGLFTLPAPEETPMLASPVAVSGCTAVAAISPTGHLSYLVVNAVTRTVSYTMYGYHSQKLVKLVAAAGMAVIAVDATGNVVFLNSHSNAVAVVAKVAAPDSMAVSGDFSHPDHTKFALLGRPGTMSVVVAGISIDSTATLHSADPPLLEPMHCTDCVVAITADLELSATAIAGRKLIALSGSSGVTVKTVIVGSFLVPVQQIAMTSGNHPFLSVAVSPESAKVHLVTALGDLLLVDCCVDTIVKLDLKSTCGQPYKCRTLAQGPSGNVLVLAEHAPGKHEVITINDT